MKAEKSFFEIEKEKQLRRDIIQHQGDREKLWNDLKSIKSRLTYYLVLNEKETLEHKLPIKKFNIDIGGTERLIKEKLVYIQKNESELKKFCKKKKNMFSFIKEHSWNEFTVKSLKVRAVSASFFVENYPIKNVDEKLGNETWINEALQREDMINVINILCPWFDKTVTLTCLQFPEIHFDQPTTNVADKFVTAVAKIYDRCLKARSTSSHLFITPIVVRSEVVNIEDESQVFEHNARVYVRKATI